MLCNMINCGQVMDNFLDLGLVKDIKAVWYY